jgi:2-keto-4-pentenoate hydratase
MIDNRIQLLAETFFRLFREGQSGGQPLTSIQELSLEDSYRIQDALIKLRLGSGERVAGYKVGCTSKAIRDQFGLSEPIFGRLLEPYIYYGETVLRCADFTNCALEPEFVFHIGKDLRDDQLDDQSLLQAIDYVSAGTELHHYKFWFGEPTSQELIATNGIHAGLVIGTDRVKASELDLISTKVSLVVDDQLMASGTGQEIMDGGPLLSLRWLLRHLFRRGEYLPAGSIVIPGSPVKLIPVKAGNVAIASLTEIGSVRTRFI